MATFTTQPIRIAVLEADTPAPQTAAIYGGYGGVFETLLKAGATSVRLPLEKLEVSAWDVEHKQEYPALEDVDAVLITGSRHNSFDDEPWINQLVDFVKKILAQDRVRLIGVCFGHQIIGRALDVKVGRSSIGWEASVCEVQLTEKGRELFKKDKLSLHQMHKDIVFEYPPSVERLGTSDRCEVQGMYIPRRMMTVQGHPEFNAQIVTELLEIRHAQGIFDDTTYEEYMDRVGKDHDGVAVAGAFLRFLMEEQKSGCVHPIWVEGEGTRALLHLES